MRAILVDDEPDGIRTLKKLLELHCPEVEIVATCSNAVMAEQKLGELKPDLVFLDVQMPGKSGLEMLAGLSEMNFKVIFVTAHNEYVLQALRFSAVDYLMKPVDEDRLIEAVMRAKERVRQEKDPEQTETLLHNINKVGSPMEMRLCLPTLKGFSVVKLEEIVYCEAQRSYTIFRLVDNKTIIISTHLLEEVEAICTRAVIIDQGRIVADATPAELAARSASGRLDDVFRQLTTRDTAMTGAAA